MPITKARVVRWLALIVFIPLLLFTAYTYVVLHWSYSSGERAGYVQKFSKRGWVFKTWEGELAMVSMPGTTPEKFYFTVKDDSVAIAINRTLGRRVALGYNQHIGVPSTAFGETEYFVDQIRVLDSPPQ